MQVPHKKGLRLFGILWMIILLGRRMRIRKLDYIYFIIHSLKKRRMGGFDGGIDGYPYLTHLI